MPPSPRTVPISYRSARSRTSDICSRCLCRIAGAHAPGRSERAKFRPPRVSWQLRLVGSMRHRRGRMQPVGRDSCAPGVSTIAPSPAVSPRTTPGNVHAVLDAAAPAADLKSRVRSLSGRMLHRDHRQAVDAREVIGVDGETGRSLAIAIAAIMASKDLAAGLRPDRRTEAATRPKARAAAASNGRGSKSASACCRCAWRTTRSSSDCCKQRPQGQLGEGDGGDQRLEREDRRVSQARQQDHHAGIQQSRFRVRHSDVSKVRSMSRRRSMGSYDGRFRHRASNCSRLRRSRRGARLAGARRRRRVPAAPISGRPLRDTRTRSRAQHRARPTIAAAPGPGWPAPAFRHAPLRP